MYSLDPSEGIFQSRKIALRRVHEKRIAISLSHVRIPMRRGVSAENLKRSIVIQAGEPACSSSDHISHPEDRRVIISHVDEISRLSDSIVVAPREAKPLGNDFQARRGARSEDNAVLVGARVKMTQDPE